MHNNITPPYLKKGDTIAIVCPSGFLPLENSTACKKTLISWGFNVFVGKTIGLQKNYFAGTDTERLQDLQAAINNPVVKAIICGRGGYGMSRIIDDINFASLVENPKWIIGFSDITLLLTHILVNHNICSVHGPMANAFNNTNIQYTQTLQNVLLGNKINYTTPFYANNIFGKAKGILIGGNLTMLAHMAGSPSFYKQQNTYLLFIEDVGEYLYSIDRMLHQLKRCGLFNNVAGLIVGGFTNLKDTDIPFGKNIEEIIINVVEHLQIPVCFNFPISHAENNIAVKLGMEYELLVTTTKTTLIEL